MTIKVIDKKAPDFLVLPMLQNERLAGRLAEVAARAGVDPAALQNDFLADAKEVFVLYASGTPTRRFYLVGLGKKQGFADVQGVMRSFAFRFKQKLPAKLGLDLRDFSNEELPRMAEALVCGLQMGLYQTGLYQSPNKDKPAPAFGSAKSQLDILVAAEVTKACETAVQRATVFSETTTQLMSLMNMPGNYKTPQFMADWAREAAQNCGFQVKVLDRNALQQEGLEALLAVGQGSIYPPALIMLEYGVKTRKHKTPALGLVGKGVTFDTGGISIKPSGNMHLMKSDMGGAAAVLGAFMVAARLQLPIRLIGAIPVAENMVDAQAIRPGDVIGSFAGKTIEVTDTDAEGRLILADGLAYLLKQEKPDVLLDLATLTGSIIRAIGYHAAGLFTQNDDLAAQLTASGDQCGERLWRMPMWDEYGSDLKSDVADLRNYTGKPMSESISAAKFLEHFTAEHPAWAHLDIAGTAFGDSEFAQTKSATGYGIRLLVEFAEKMIG